MTVLVKFFGIVIILFGVVFLISPKAMKQYIAFWANVKGVRLGGIFSLLFGIVFLVAASQCKMVWLVAILGILGIAKGAIIIVLGPKKLKPIFDWWQNRPDTFLRLYSLMALAFGILLICSA